MGADCIDYGAYLHWEGGVDTPGSVLDVAVAGAHAYAADADHGLQVIDITSPEGPEIVDSAGMPDDAYGVAASDTYAYVADGFGGVQILPAQCEPALISLGGHVASALSIRVSPNPASNQIAIRFELPAPERVCVNIYDAAGHRVRCLSDGILGSGAQDLIWDGCEDKGRLVPAGVYFIRVETARCVRTGRIVLAW